MDVRLSLPSLPFPHSPVPTIGPASVAVQRAQAATAGDTYYPREGGVGEDCLRGV
jgi:hypothetical protein